MSGGISHGDYCVVVICHGAICPGGISGCALKFYSQ